jgi:uncharacterized protein DUF4058
MPSPFPGMDPYLEEPDIWADLHHSLAAAASGELNQTLPKGHYALLNSRPEMGVLPDGDWTHIEPLHHLFIEIRDSTDDHKLLTVIEFLSPSCKRPGPDRQAYQRKQQGILGSDANLIEIDLLRRGERVLSGPEVAAIFSQLEPAPDYLVLVNRSWRRASFQAFPFSLREWLPCIPVPLRQGETEMPLDLQFVFNGVYDSGPYQRGAVDYGRPPSSFLPEADARWAEELLARAETQNGGNAPK